MHFPERRQVRRFFYACGQPAAAPGRCDNRRPMEWIIVSLASMLAGFVDAIVGGGGLILLPALFATFPTAPPATLLGTNKSASVWGTAMSTWQYVRHVQLLRVPVRAADGL